MKRFAILIGVLGLGWIPSSELQAQTITPGQDCITAPTVCGGGSFNYTTGSGAVQDFVYGSGSNPTTNPAGFNSGCLLAGELNPMMIIINVQSSGTLEWTFGSAAGSTGCQDWIMWPYTPATCGQIAAGTLPPVACNWNGACSGFTGMATPVPAGGNPADFQNELPVTAGQQFLLCISNYSSQSGLANLNFIGTAGIGCGGDTSICLGSSVNFNVTTAGAVSYSWSPPTGLSSTTTATPTASPTTTTLYTCTVNFGAFSTDTLINVTVNNPATLSFSMTPETCQGDFDGTLTVTPTGTGPFTYALNGVPQPSGTFTGLGGGNYLVEVTDANGCTADSLYAFPSGPICCNLVLNTTSTPTSCPYNCDGTANVNIAGSANPPVVNWTLGGNSIGQTNPTANGLCPGNYVVEVTDPGQCTLTANVTVTAQPGITITSVATTNVLCQGACDGTLTVTAPTATQYSIDGGVTFQASNIFNALCAATYQVIAENANGCQDTLMSTITEPATLTVQLAVGGQNDVSCFGAADGSLDMDVAGGTAPYNYSWNTTPVQNTQDANNLPAGNWCLSVTDANGCLGNACITITEPTQMSMNFAVVDPSCFAFCDGNATVIPNGGTTPYSYNWHGIAGTTNTTTQATGLCDGMYNLTVTDANGCIVDTLNWQVTQPAQVQVGTITPTDETCYHACDGQIVIASPDAVLYSITGGTNFQPGGTFSNLCDGVYAIVVEDANGCQNTGTTTLISPNEVIAEFSGSPQPTDVYQTEITFTNLSAYGNTFQWTFDSLGTSGQSDPVFFFPDSGPGIYDVCLVATDVNGCADTVCHPIEIKDILYYYVPNAFTPDGNGVNDIFIPVLNNVSEDRYEFYVFNRWGEMVFKTNDITEGWDGTHNNMKAKSDTYVWKIVGRNKSDAKKFQAIGHVTLLR